MGSEIVSESVQVMKPGLQSVSGPEFVLESVPESVPESGYSRCECNVVMDSRFLMNSPFLTERGVCPNGFKSCVLFVSRWARFQLSPALSNTSSDVLNFSVASYEEGVCSLAMRNERAHFPVQLKIDARHWVI